jgi:hypothetical protein
LESEHSRRDIPVGNEVVRVAGDEQVRVHVRSTQNLTHSFRWSAMSLQAVTVIW